MSNNKLCGAVYKPITQYTSLTFSPPTICQLPANHGSSHQSGEVTWDIGYTKYRVYEDLTCEDYRNAPSGIGPLAHEWEDKPHRLIYDLIKRIRELEKKEL